MVSMFLVADELSLTLSCAACIITLLGMYYYVVHPRRINKLQYSRQQLVLFQHRFNSIDASVRVVPLWEVMDGQLKVHTVLVSAWQLAGLLTSSASCDSYTRNRFLMSRVYVVGPGGLEVCAAFSSRGRRPGFSSKTSADILFCDDKRLSGAENHAFVFGISVTDRHGIKLSVLQRMTCCIRVRVQEIGHIVMNY